MTSTTSEARTRDGLTLLTRRWASPDPWAVALLVHGLGEHSGRYEGLGDRLAAAGVETHAYDQRGFGASEGRRAYVRRWEEFGRDLADRAYAVRRAVADVPFVLYGHSLGGLIVLDAVVRDVVRPDLLVLSAPGLGDTIAPWRRAAARILARVAPTVAVANGLPADGLARDPDVADAIREDPLSLSPSTIGLGGAAFDAQRRLNDRLAAMSALPVPTYVLHGSADPIVPVDASAVLARFPEVTRVVHDGLRHEAHHEPEADEVIDAVLDWLRRRVAALHSP